MEGNAKKASNYDELLMDHSALFTDGLKDLKSLSKQLYSAAEHFELTYNKQNQQQLVVGTLKDYVNNAMISTVDHLGSIAYRMNEFLDEKVDEVSRAEIRVSCLEQRIRTVKYFIDLSGISQETFLIKTPKYHKQYIIPGKNQDIGQCGPLVEHDSNKPKTAILATKVKLHSPLHRHREGHSISPLTKSVSPETFSFTRIVPNEPPEKRFISPLLFPLKRLGSSGRIQQYPLELNRSASVITGAHDMRKEIQPYSKKSKPLLKALLTMYKHKKDGRV